MFGKRTFPLADILSVATGRLLAKVETLYEVCGFMIGESLYTHQLVRASKVCAADLKRQIPALDGGEMVFAFGELLLMLDSEPGKQDPPALIGGWLAKLQCGGYGLTLQAEYEIEPLPKGRYLPMDPIEELLQMRPGMEVIEVVV